MNLLQTNYETARAAALSQIAWMHQKNLADADRQGGVEHLRQNPTTDAGKRFLGIEQRLIKLAAFDDAATDYIAHLLRVIENQADTISQQDAEIRQLKREIKPPLEPAERIPFRTYLQLMLIPSPIPKKIGSLIDYREGRRQASRTYAATTQPNLF